MRLKDRVAIVTGAAGGIGEAIALAFADEGAVLAVTDINGEGVEATAAAIRAKGGTADATAMDVTDQAAVRPLVADTVARHGQLDILANVAGTASFGHFLEVEAAEFERVMRVNLHASFYCAQAAAAEMVKRGYGRIVNIASIAGSRAGEARTAYGTSKAAVIGLTQQAARDLASSGITVNAIGPGPVDTALTRATHTENTRTNYRRHIPAQRYGTVEEMADAAVFLASEAAGYVNGHILFVDGGYEMAGVGEYSTD